MKLQIKMLGTVLVGILLASSCAASPASAEKQYHWETETSSQEGSQLTQNVFKTAAGEVKCNSMTVKGSSSATTASSLTLFPIWIGCTAFGETAHVTSTGCDFHLGTPTTTPTGFHAPVSIICATGSVISITVTVFGSSICTMTIGAQTGIGNFDFTNQGSGTTRDVLITSTATGIDYTVDGGGGFCGSTGLHTDGTYTGTITTKGFSGGKQVGFWVG